MKNFFEFIGFGATALASGVLFFLVMGKMKDKQPETVSEKPAAETLTTRKNASGIEYDEADFKENIAGSTTTMRNQEASFAAAEPARTGSKTPRRTPAVEDVPAKKSAVSPIATPAKSAEADLREIFTDEIFTKTMLSKWKSRVAEKAAANNLRPDLLMANVLVKTYLGEYNSTDFQRDVARHRGDAELPETTALKNYEQSKTIASLVRMHDLDRVFAHSAGPKFTSKKESKREAKNVETISAAAKKRSKDKRKPIEPTATAEPNVKKINQSEEKTKPAEVIAREAAAKEFGFKTWEGLQLLGSPDLKAKAGKRVKTLLLTARIR